MITRSTIRIIFTLIFYLINSRLLSFAEATPQPAPQIINIDGSFSGAVYVVPAFGQPLFSSASPAQCPAGQQVCSNISTWNWCCPLGNTCSQINSGQIACCPTGSICSGLSGSITTITGNSLVVFPSQTVDTTSINPIFPETTTVVFTPTSSYGIIPSGAIQTLQTTINSYTVTMTMTSEGAACTSMTMAGLNSPTFARADCGTMLILPSESDVDRGIPWKLFGLCILSIFVTGL